MDRRSFIKSAGALSLGALAVPNLVAGDVASAVGRSPKPTRRTSRPTSASRQVKLGFIALTDCASIVMAQELGYFAERDLEVSVEKQQSWPATRDALQNGQIDGAHCLVSMPLSVATGIGGSGARDLKIAMMLSNNGQGLTLSNDYAAAGYGDLAAAYEALTAGGTPTLGMTFPGGTHDTWLKYWLLAAGVKLSDVKIDPIPPPQMVQNMTVGNVDGYSVGEPWNAVAVQQGIGFTTMATQDLWEHHPEKALVVSDEFASERTDVLMDVMAAIIDASRWLDEPANRSEAADVLGTPNYVNAPADDIRGRLTGVYDLGADLGEMTFESNQMQFFRGGDVNLPRRGHAIWFLAQFQRFGFLDEAPPYQELADELILTDLYAEVAEAADIDIPDDDMAPFEVKLDGVTFDPANPDEEAARP